MTRPSEGVRFDLEEGSYPVVVSHRGELLKDVIHVRPGQARFVLDLARQVVLGPSRVVVRYLDGTIVRGVTEDFTPGGEQFTVRTPDGERKAIRGYAGIKAILFVKTLEGNRAYQDQQDFAIASQFGRRTIVRFTDGEEMRGYTLPGHADTRHFSCFRWIPRATT